MDYEFALAESIGSGIRATRHLLGKSDLNLEYTAS